MVIWLDASSDDVEPFSFSPSLPRLSSSYHFAILVFRLKPFRKDEVAYLYAVYFVEARFHRVTNFVGHERLAPPARFVSVKTLCIQIDARVGQHFKYLVRHR